MKMQLVEKYLNEDIPNFLKESLASHYKDVLTFGESVPFIYIKFLAYHAIAYFQYLNSLGVSDAIKLYKAYILSDGKITTFRYNGLEIPLKFDELLISVSQTLMKYKDIVESITINDYISHFKYSHDIVPTYITLYNLLDVIKKIGLDGIAALRRHWVIINKEFIPYLLKNLKISSTI
jgi:hypothetical protein